MAARYPCRVVPGSEFHLTEYFAPVLGVMRVDTLQEAIDAVNAVDYGLTSGLHTLDADELAVWLEAVEAGNLYVNRGITGAIVRRQPFGGWKRSAIGSTTKAGGPSYLLGLGEVVPAAGQDHEAAYQGRHDLATTLDTRVSKLYDAVRTHLDRQDMARLRRALVADAEAWSAEYGVARDVTGLACERNVLRYRPTPVVVRAAGGTHPADLVRVAAAGVLAGAYVSLSVADELPAELADALAAADVDVEVEAPGVWNARLADLAASEALGLRVRLLGPREEAADFRWRDASRLTAAARYRLVHRARDDLPAHRAAALPARAGRGGHQSPLRHALQPCRGAALAPASASSGLCRRPPQPRIPRVPRGPCGAEGVIAVPPLAACGRLG